MIDLETSNSIFLWMYRGSILIIVSLLLALAVSVMVAGQNPSAGEFRHKAMGVPYPVEVFDRNGRHIGYIGGHTTRNYGPFVGIDDLPDGLVEDLIIIEEMNPFGFSPYHFLRAAIRGGGGSTITQQVYRILTGYNDSAWPEVLWRKFVEMIGAVQVSLAFSETEILEIYVNQAQWVRGQLGLSYASRMVFDKAPSELERREWLLLMSGLTGPNHLRRSRLQTMNTTGRLREGIRNKYAGRVSLLYRKGRISSEEHRMLLEDKPVPNPVVRPPSHTGVFLDAVERALASKVLPVIGSALEVHTPLDLDLQSAVHMALTQAVEDGTSGTSFTMLNASYEPLVYYVDVNDCENSAGDTQCRRGNQRGDLDRIQTSDLRPASRLKALLYPLYIDSLMGAGHSAAAIQRKKLPNRFDLPSGQIISDGDEPMPFLEAVATSANAPAYSAISSVGPDSFSKFLTRLGFRRPLEPYLSLALGAVSIRESDLARAYVALFLNNQPGAHDLSLLRHVIDLREQATIYSSKSETDRGQSLVREEALDVTREMLRHATFSGTARGLTRPNANGDLWRTNIYGKTGTSEAGSTEARSPYRWMGITGVLGEHVFSLTRRGNGLNGHTSTTAAVPAAREVLQEMCRNHPSVCSMATDWNTVSAFSQNDEQ